MVVTAVASAGAAMMAVKMASQQEDATYKSIVVAREIESSAIVVEQMSSLISASSELRLRLDIRDLFPKVIGTRVESIEVGRYMEQNSVSFAEANKNLHQLRVLLLGGSNFMSSTEAHLRMLHMENAWLAEALLDPKKRARNLVKARPEFETAIAAVKLDQAVFASCARSYFVDGKPMVLEIFEACVAEKSSSYAPIYLVKKFTPP